jgi:hypothetical protein
MGPAIRGAGRPAAGLHRPLGHARPRPEGVSLPIGRPRTLTRVDCQQQRQDDPRPRSARPVSRRRPLWGAAGGGPTAERGQDGPSGPLLIRSRPSCPSHACTSIESWQPVLRRTGREAARSWRPRGRKRWRPAVPSGGVGHAGSAPSSWPASALHGDTARRRVRRAIVGGEVGPPAVAGHWDVHGRLRISEETPVGVAPTFYAEGALGAR